MLGYDMRDMTNPKPSRITSNNLIKHPWAFPKLSPALDMELWELLSAISLRGRYHHHDVNKTRGDGWVRQLTIMFEWLSIGSHAKLSLDIIFPSSHRADNGQYCVCFQNILRRSLVFRFREPLAKQRTQDWCKRNKQREDKSKETDGCNSQGSYPDYPLSGGVQTIEFW